LNNYTLIMNSDKQRQIQNIVNKYLLVLLDSDYLDTSSFYLDRTTHFIWQVVNTDPGNAIFFKPSEDIAQHIAQLNNITQNRYNTQPGIFNEI